MNYNIYKWLEEYLFYANTFMQKILSFLLLPFGLIYGALAFVKRYFNPSVNMGIPIISIGNLSMGGNGKTPLAIAIARNLEEKTTIILRGYKRKSTGLLEVSYQGKILCDISQSGDEAMLIASRIPFANVVVSEDRLEAIKLAKTQDVKYIILDDGFSKSHIQKYDILIQSNEFNKLNKRVIPSGCYREFAFTQKYANKIAIEGIDFYKKTHMPIIGNVSSTVLITSISKPQRLDAHLPKDINKAYFKDHHLFTINELLNIVNKYNAKTILTTKKDFVKIKSLDVSKLGDIKIEIIYLEVKISQDFSNELKKYINS